MHTAGRESGEAFGSEFARGIQRSAPRAQAALIGVQSATEKLRIEQEKLADAMRSNDDFDKVAAQAEKVTRAHKKHDSAVRDLQNAYDTFDSSAKTASTAASGLTRNVSQLGGAMAALGKIGTPVAVVGLGAALVEAAGIAASAAQSLWLLPAALTAGGAAFGTMKLATLGFSDALDSIKDPEKFAEALRQLSPQAQQAALSIRALMPAFDGLKSATQDALFAGIGQQLTALTNQYLPTVQRMTTGIAGAFGNMFKGIADQLMTPQTFGAMHEAMNNIATAFQNLAPAAAPLASAFAEITKVGSGVLPEIATAAAQAAQAFSDFITEASRSGELESWLREGLTTIKQLGQGAFALAGAFMQLAPVGSAILPDILRILEGIEPLMPSIAASAVLVGPAIGPWAEAADTARVAVEMLQNAFASLVNFILPTANRIGEAISNAFDPIRQAAKLAGIDIPKFTPIDPISYGPNSGSSPWSKDGTGPAGTPVVPGMPGMPGTSPGGPFASPQVGNGIGSAFNPGRTWQSPRLPGNTMASYSPSSGSGSATSDLPEVPYSGDPMELIKGFPVTSALYGAADSLIDARNRRAQDESDLNAVLADNTATEAEIQKKRNDLAKSEREQQEAEIRLNEAKRTATEKTTNQMQDAANGLNSLSAGLDADLGISGGLAGIADNLVRFFGNLATAPIQAALDNLIKANPNEGSGLIGIAAAQGAFGEQFTPQAIAASQQSASYPAQYASAYAPQYGAAPSFAAQPGQSARDFAHSTMMPYWQSQGLTVGDHAADYAGEHQNGALDIMVPDIATGNQVLQQVLSDPNVYGAIFNRKSYGYGNGATPQDYSGPSPHTDHVHAWYKPGGQNNITPASQYGGAPSWSQGMPTVPNLPISSGGGQSPILGNGPSAGIGNAVSGYQPIQQPQAPQGWQPGGGSGGGGILGAAGGAIAGMFPGAGAAAQIAMQAIQRTIQFGGEMAGHAVQGIQDFWSVSDPDGGSGASIADSWMGRLAGSLAQASPALPSTAGKQDRKPEQSNAANAVQGAQGPQGPGGPTVQIDRFIQAPNRNSQQVLKDMALQGYSSGFR